ncbi:MAG: putative ABC transport system permease protein [Candidatus Berkelbacteria bacterium Athens1014_28]|uniref:Putative ABC transport system permease protein n=1 Tax=Candidatus Berkelbacteria bacterium Athens1014_28 TaxID=2017145 RepID=A0A554LN81_9BACT|nr:MAG: putative ABC transport system permease protein [Candidatus Berkelbacteria bacterium Athens1014_28]
MDKGFIVEFAFKNLINHRLRTILTLVGVIIGISAVVFLLAFAFGVERLVTLEVTGGDAFKLIDIGTGNSQIVKLNNTAVNEIGALNNVRLIKTTTNVAAKVKEGNNTMDVAFFASSPEYFEWSGIRPKWGKNISEGKNNEIMINSNCISFLKTTHPEDVIGKTLTLDLILPKELLENGNNKVVANQKFSIVGVIQNNATPSIYGLNQVLADNNVVNYSQAKVEINNNNKVLELRKQIESMGFKTQYVGDTISQIQQIFNIFKLILGSFGLIALIVASIGMFNTLTISLLERMREVALLKILGARRRDISRLFLTEALIFGAIGGVLGTGMGILIGKITNFVLNIYATRGGGDAVSVFYFPIWLIVTSVIFSILIGLLTGIYPSRRAARIAPLDIIRYE